MGNPVDFDPDQVLPAFAQIDGMNERLCFNEPLAAHCSLRIGGPAAVWAEVNSVDELRQVVEAGEAEGLEAHVVGLGSNVLFPDEGIQGVVIRLGGELADYSLEEQSDGTAVMQIGAGAVNAHSVRAMHRNDWVGAEFLALIPGTFGGAVALNAGTKDAELSEVLLDVDLLVPEAATGEWVRRTLTPAELGLSYRHSELPAGAIVVGGRIRVNRGDVDRAREHLRADKARRNRTQPYKLASVGSTFANPEGDYAGRVIEEVGLKGHAIGGARISELHANFFINEDGATADDFLQLMALARAKVRRRFDLELRPEVRFVGFDGLEKLLAYEHKFEEQGC